MPTYSITDPATGRTVRLSGDSPPTEKELVEVFSVVGNAAQAPTIAAGPAMAPARAVGRPPPQFMPMPGALSPQMPRGVAGAVLGPIVDVGLEAGGATAGQLGGAPLAPFTFGASVPIGGAIGGAIGNYAAQRRQIAAGERPNVSPGQVMGAAFAGLFPGTSLAKAGAKTIGTQMLKQGAANIGAAATETLVDEGKLPSGPRAALAGAGGVIGTGIGKALDNGANVTVQRAMLKKAQDTTRRETLELARKLPEGGYVIPTSILRPNVTQDELNSLAGKAAAMQEAAKRNQNVTNAAVREELGLPPTSFLGPNKNNQFPALNAAKVGPNAVYSEVSAASPRMKTMLDEFKQKQAEANGAFAAYRDQNPKMPSVLAQAKQLQSDADSMVAQMTTEAKSLGNTDLMDRFAEARVKLAKIGLVGEAINPGDGNVDAAIIGRTYAESPERLTGNLATIGRFWNAFPNAVREAAKSPPAGVDKMGLMLTGMTSVGAGAAGYAAHGAPGALLGAIPLAAATLGPRVAREVTLSPTYQRMFANPTYGPTRPDVQAMLARFGAQAASRGEPQHPYVQRRP